MKVRAVLLMLAVAATSALVLSACGSSGSSTSSSSGSSGEGNKGGTLKVEYASFPDYLDPQLSYTVEGWVAQRDVYIPLLTYKHVNGEEGTEVAPALVKELPKITNGEKTYTMFLKPGLKYSNGKPVVASDFTYAVERLFKVNGGGSVFFTSIVGAEKFAETKTGGIPGIKTNDKTGEIQITLTKPRGTFQNELGLYFTAPVPKGTPDEDLTASPAPSVGPYTITASKPGQSWEYQRNPYWAKDNAKLLPEIPSGNADKIEVDVVRNPRTEVDNIEQGTYNWMENPVPADRYAAVKAKYEGTQFKIQPTISTYDFWMNTSTPPFNDLKVREAVNYAIDPAALERIYAGQIKASQQILPPGLKGYKKYELYPRDMAKAKELMKEANPSDKEITVWTDTESPNNEAGEYYEGVLKELGFEPKLKVINADNYFTVIGNASTPNLDTGFSDWYQDYPHPSDFFQPLFSEESILPVNSSNFAHLENPAITKKINDLSEKQLTPAVEAEYAELDEETMKEAPWAPFGTRTLDTFVSSNINLEAVVFNSVFNEDMATLEFK